MDIITVLPQVGEWTAYNAEGLRDYRDMEKTVASPRLRERARKQVYSREETRKGKIKMERYKDTPALPNIGGWLTLFPIRLAAAVAGLLILNTNVVLTIIYILATGCCAALFCLHCRGFRTVYIGVAVAGLALGIAALPDSAAYLIAKMVVEAALIPALYRSRRVKRTFFRCGSGFVRHAEESRRCAEACIDEYKRIR